MYVCLLHGCYNREILHTYISCFLTFCAKGRQDDPFTEYLPHLCLSILFLFLYFVLLFLSLYSLSFLISSFLSFMSLSCSLQPSALVCFSGYIVGMMAYSPFHTEKHYKRRTQREAGKERRQTRKKQKQLYLANIESPGLGEVRAKRQRKALIKVSPRKAAPPRSLPFSQNQCSKIPQSQILLHPINYSTCLFCTTTPVYKDCLANCKCLHAR